MRRKNVDGEGSSDANQGASLSHSDRRLGTVIPFRRVRSSSDVAGDAMPPLASPFVSLGEAAQSVILTIQGRRYPISAPVQTREDDDLDRL